MQQIEQSFAGKVAVYLFYLLVSCLFTAMLNYGHSHIINVQLTPQSFIAPTVAGLVFGYLLARISLLRRLLENMAHTDPLTQAYNRLHFGHFLEAELDKVERYGGSVSIIFFDLDYFKLINDKHGHMTGDKALEQVTSVVDNANRSSDILARYGGEEFIILAPSTDIEGAVQHAERLRLDIANHSFTPIKKLTCSFGVTEYRIKEDTSKTFIKRADDALYKAKNQGRNCVVKV